MLDAGLDAEEATPHSVSALSRSCSSSSVSPGRTVPAVEGLVMLSQSAGDEAVFSALLASGESLDPRRPEVAAELSLCLAAGRGDLQVVHQLLRSGVEANCSPSFGGMTPLMFAARFGHLATVEVLLQHPGVQLYSMTNAGHTALSLCQEEVTRRMLAHSIATRSGDGGRYALLQAACFGHTLVLRALLEAEVDPNQQDEMGRSALLIAALRKHLEACEVLLAFGAAPGPKVSQGASAWRIPDAKLQMVLQFYAQ